MHDVNDFPSRDELKGTVQGTLLYLSLYVGVFIPFQAFSKFYLLKKKKDEAHKKGGQAKPFRSIKYYNSEDMLALIGDRAVGQYVEYTIVFLPLLWMHALFVDPSQSFTICALYTASRSIYPFVFGNNVYPGVLWSAFPNYIILTYLFGSLILSLYVWK